MEHIMMEEGSPLPQVEESIFIYRQGRVMHVRVSGVNAKNRMIALHGHEGWYNWDLLGPQQAYLCAVFVLGEEVVD